MGFLSRTVFKELPNGVRLCCFPCRGASVELQCRIAGGSIHEGEFLGCGISHFLEHMAFQGCAGFPERMVSAEVSRLGGDVNAYTSCDHTCYRMQLPSGYWKRGAEMLASMVRFPELPELRFAEERKVILRECERSDDDPARRMYDAFMRTMFLRHPLRYPVIGFPEMISGVTREMAMTYHRRRYTPERCIFVAAGNVEPEDFFAGAEELLGDWSRSRLEEPVLPDEPLPLTARRGEVIFPDPLERIFYGVRVPELGDPELPAVRLLFNLLGVGDTSILYSDLVLKRALGLDLHSFCYSLGKISLAGIFGKAEPGKMSRFRSALLALLADTAAGKTLSAAHLKREKEQMYADRLRGLRDLTNIAGEIAGGVLYDNTPEAGDADLEYLRRVDPGMVRRAAEKYLDPDHWVMIHQHKAARKRKISLPSELPRLDVLEAPGGETVVFAPDKQLPLCHFFMAFPGGSICEKRGEYGVSKLLAASLTAGCEGMEEDRFLRKLDEAGVSLDISSGANTLILEFSAPRGRMGRAVALVSDMLRAPAIPDRALERERIQLLETCRERAEIPLKAASDRAMRMMYGDHPYACTNGGRIGDILRIDRQMVLDFYAGCRNSGGIVWGFGGDCRERDVEGWNILVSSSVRGGGPGHGFPAGPPVVFPAEKQRAEFSLPREQTVALRMIPGVSSASDERGMDMLDILCQAENGLASRLFESVREKHALSYSVGMSYFAGRARGTVSFYAMTEAGAGETVMRLLNEEICRLGETGLDAGEWEAAKAGAIFNQRRILEAPESVIRSEAMDQFYGIGAERVLSRVERIASWRLEEFNRMLKDYFLDPSGVEVLVAKNF